MAPSSPRTRDEERQQEVSQSTRERLFTFRRHELSQQPPDFFTDSINTSHIPIPSPTKEKNFRGIRAKPRQVLGTPRSLAAAFKASSELNKEYQPPSPASSPDRKRSLPTPKIQSARESVNSRYITQGKQDDSPSVRRTPSPLRGRPLSIISPSSSASSPPRGLAEAYQRINDEEILAQEDSVEQDMSVFLYGSETRDRSPETNSVRLTRLQESPPLSWKGSQPASPHGLDKELEEAGETQESDTESALTTSDNMTDHSAASQYARDLQRMKGATKSDAQPFRKARVGNKVGLTVENLKRQNGSNESLGDASQGLGNISSRGSDYAVNIPREWGRKAKPGIDWLNRINSNSGRFTGDLPKRKHGGLGKSDQMEPSKRPAEAAPEVQSTSSQTSTPTKANANLSFERIADWEFADDDFTSRSIQVSDSPPARVRPDPNLEREIDTVAKRAVTTNRLDELRERTSEESPRRKLHSRSEEDLRSQSDEKLPDTLHRRRSSVRSPLKPIFEDKNHFNHGDAHVEDRDRVLSDSIALMSSSGKPEATQEPSEVFAGDDMRRPSRPDYKREDSRDLLRRLARVTSQSPSTKAEPLETLVNAYPKHSVASQDRPHTSEAVMKVVPELVDATYDDDDDDDDGVHQNRKKMAYGNAVQQTPQASKSAPDLKTPLVTGAWIDTPLPKSTGGPPLPTPADLEDDQNLTLEFSNETRKVAATDLIRKLNPNILSTRPKPNSAEPLKNSGPVLPESALKSIISEAKATCATHKPKPRAKSMGLDNVSDEEPPLILGETTIQSLEEFVEDDTQTSTRLPPSPPSSTATPPGDDVIPHKTFTSAQGASLSNIQSVSRQLSRLDHVGPSIRETKRRLATLEHAISTSISLPTPKSSSPENECDEGGEVHDFIWPCKRCGCRGSPIATQTDGSSSQISIPIPRLWKWRNQDRRPRLTWWGVVTLVLLGYQMAESIARLVPEALVLALIPWANYSNIFEEASPASTKHRY